jgi:type IV pilus assembly protein PilN
MIRINLLPTKFKSKTKGAKEFIFLYLASVVLLLAVIGYLWSDQRSRVEDLKRRLAELERQVKDLSDFEKKLKDLREKKALVARKSQVVENLGEDRDKTARLMAVLAVNAPPEKIWFEKLQESKGKVTINGVAKSDDTIVEFMRNLEASPYIALGTVNLKHSRKKGELRDFQLSCEFVPFSKISRAGAQVHPYEIAIADPSDEKCTELRNALLKVSTDAKNGVPVNKLVESVNVEMGKLGCDLTFKTTSLNEFLSSATPARIEEWARDAYGKCKAKVK